MMVMIEMMMVMVIISIMRMIMLMVEVIVNLLCSKVAMIEERRTHLLNQLHFRASTKREKLGEIF